MPASGSFGLLVAGSVGHLASAPTRDPKFEPSRSGFTLTLKTVPGGNVVPGDPLLRHRGGARHLDAPLDVLPVRALGQRLVIRRQHDDVQLGVVRLRDELFDDAGQGHDLGLVVHRERVMGRDRNDDERRQQNRSRHNDARVHECLQPGPLRGSRPTYRVSPGLLREDRPISIYLPKISVTAAGRSSCGLSQPVSKYFSQFFAHGRP